MNNLEALKRRDPEYYEIDDKMIMLLACDSCGAVGLKEFDVVSAPNELVGGLTARVPVLELLSLGADIKMISITLANEDNPTAKEIISGVKSELKNYDIKYVISTEKNMKTVMTGLGISLVAMVEKNNLRLISDYDDDFYLYMAGLPSLGEEVIKNKDLIFNQEMLKSLIADKDVLEIIPCGSKGIIGELSKIKGIDISKYSNEAEFVKSCGPSTAAIVISKVDLSGSYDFLRSIDK